MADKARHAFGSLENVDTALSAGTIDAYDILFVKDSEGKPYVGWIDKDGNKVIVEEDVSALETQVSELETQMESKVDSATVETMIKTAVSEATGVEVVEF